MLDRRAGEVWDAPVDGRDVPPGRYRRAKFFLPIGASGFKSALNRSDNCFAHAIRIAKTHFALGRMNIYIHECRDPDAQEKET